MWAYVWEYNLVLLQCFVCVLEFQRGVLVVVRIVFHLCVSTAHKEAKCLRSMFEYWSGLQFCRTSLSYSFVPCWHWIVCMLSIRMESVACEADLKLDAISFSRYSRGRLSRARPRMVLASLRVRSVGSLSGFDSRASVGQCPNWVRSRRVCA